MVAQGRGGRYGAGGGARSYVSCCARGGVYTRLVVVEGSFE